jgi:hypothetical protein
MDKRVILARWAISTRCWRTGSGGTQILVSSPLASKVSKIRAAILSFITRERVIKATRGGVDNSHGLDVGQQAVVNFPGVCGHFDHYRVLWGESLAHPIVQVSILNPARSELWGEFSIHPIGDQIMLVHVKTDKAFRDCFLGFHRGILHLWGPANLAGDAGRIIFWDKPSHTDTGWLVCSELPSLVNPNGQSNKITGWI